MNEQSMPWQVERARKLAVLLRRNYWVVNGQPSGISQEAAASEVDLLADELARALKTDGSVSRED